MARQVLPTTLVRHWERLHIGGAGIERVYYIVFKRDGKIAEEKVGRQYADDMPEAKASRIRGERIEGKRSSRKELREAEKVAKAQQESLPTIGRIWERYKEGKPRTHSFKSIKYSFNKYLAQFVGVTTSAGVVAEI